jgi:hypothetical protein
VELDGLEQSVLIRGRNQQVARDVVVSGEHFAVYQWSLVLEASFDEAIDAPGRGLTGRCSCPGRSALQSTFGTLSESMRYQPIRFSLAAAVAFGCATWSPGTDPRGRDLIETGNQLVASLEAFRSSTGHYPESLAELPSTPDLGAPGTDFDFHYEPNGEGYRLYLNYTPSWPQTGRISCFFRPGAAGWGCSGYL